MAGLFVVLTTLICTLAQALVTPNSARSRLAIERNTAPLSAQLAVKDMSLGQAIFIRILKSTDGTDKDGRLELFVKSADGTFILFKTYEVCAYSGELGPKLAQGDRQSPEGFYFIKPNSLNPNSSYHLSFNLGYPNAYDRYHGRTGDYLMVHGDCVSIGCYAMTDEGIEEMYTLVDRAFAEGQPFIRVHIFPFEMSDETLQRFSDNPNHSFWQNLQTGWKAFNDDGAPPNVEVSSSGRYLFNPAID